MRRVFKSIASAVLIPLTKWYLRKERRYENGDIKISVLPGVFHPGLFSSTGFLLEFLRHQNLKNKSFLELGCGSGFLSIAAAKVGAAVTASDISLIAVKNTELNARRNNVSFRVIHSDLFAGADHTQFDWIVINPPYYARSPKTEEDLAWYCGENFEYFIKLFAQLKNHLNPDTRIIMVLTMGCDLKKIISIGHEQGFQFDLLKEKRVLFDGKDFLYSIKPFSSIVSHQA